MSCQEPQETTPVFAVLMLPRRPCGILTKIAVSEIQMLRLVAVSPTLVRAVLALPKDDPLTKQEEPPVNADDEGMAAPTDRTTS